MPSAKQPNIDKAKLSRRQKKRLRQKEQQAKRERLKSELLPPTVEPQSEIQVEEPVSPNTNTEEVSDPETIETISLPAQKTFVGNKSTLQTILALFLLPLIGFAIYSNTFHVNFMYDDEKEIELDKKIHITQLTWANIKNAFQKRSRPVAKYSFAFNYYLDGLNTRYYHLVNILIHTANGLLLFFFLKITLALAAGSRRGPPSDWLPLAAALLWLVNPTHIQSVTYVVQRMNSMSAMFYLATLLLYIYGRLATDTKKRWGMYAGGALTTVLALASKENAATIPVFIFVYEWFFFQDLRSSWLKKRLPLIFGGILLFLAAAFFLFDINPINVIQGRYRRTTFTMAQRVMTEWRVVMFYISQLLFPHPSQFNLLHAFPLSSSIFYPITTIFSLLAIIGSLVLATIIAKKERLIAFCIFWFFGNLAIESSIIGLEIIYEHRSYLPSMMFFLLLILLGYRFIPTKPIKGALYAFLVCICCYWTYSRNAVWADEIAFWQDTIDKNPYASRAYNDLANAYAMEGKKKKAVGIYYQGLKLNPNDWKMHYNLGVILESLWETDKAIAQYNWLLRAKQNVPDTHFRLGMIYARKKEYQKAIYHTSEVIRLAPGQYPAAYTNLKAYKSWAKEAERRKTK